MTFFLLAAAALIIAGVWAIGTPYRRPGQRHIFAALAVFITVGMVGMYGWLGAPQYLRPDALQSRTPEQLFTEVSWYLEHEPGDASGWRLLADLGMRLGYYEQAAAAYEKLIASGGEQPQYLLGRADALAMAAGGTLRGLSESLVRRVLSADPEQTEALWMLSLAAFQAGDIEEALTLWWRLWPLLDDAQQKIQLYELLSANGDAVPAAIIVHVSVQPEALEHIDAALPVFLFARVPGTRMPIAAQRHRAGELPFFAVLDERTLLDTAGGWPQGSELQLSARLARSGTVAPAAGDLTAPPVLANTGDIVSLRLER